MPEKKTKCKEMESQIDTDISQRRQNLKQAVNEIYSLKSRLDPFLQSSNIGFINSVFQNAVSDIQTPDFDLDQLLDVFAAILNSSFVPKNKKSPFLLETKWIDNKDIQSKSTKDTIGFAFGGGGQTAQAIAIGLLTGLHAKGVLNSKFIDYLVFVSGSCWAGGPLAYLRYDIESLKKFADVTDVSNYNYNYEANVISSNSDLNNLFTKYVPPENLTAVDLIQKKDKRRLIHNASNTLYGVTLLKNFLKNLLDPDVPYKFVLSNTFAQDPLDQYNLFSRESILQNNISQISDAFSKNKDLENKVDSFYLLRQDFPDTFCTTMGSFSNVPGQKKYEYFQLNMNSESYGALADRYKISADVAGKTQNLVIGQRIQNYAFGSNFVRKSGRYTEKSKRIVVSVDGPQYLASLNQMVGLASCAFATAFNFNDNKLLNILNTEYVLNSQVTTESKSIFNNNQDKCFTSDGGQYDNSGQLSLFQLRCKHIFSIISAGEVIVYDPENPENNRFPKQLKDPFALSTGTERRNISPVLDPEEFIPTVQGILLSPIGVFTKSYKTLESKVNGSVLPSYKVNITWIYLNIDVWRSKLKPSVRALVDRVPNFPFNPSIKQRVNLLPLTANAYNYSMSFITFEYISEIIKSLRDNRINDEFDNLTN